jgi:hypothetical protein
MSRGGGGGVRSPAVAAELQGAELQADEEATPPADKKKRRKKKKIKADEVRRVDPRTARLCRRCPLCDLSFGGFLRKGKDRLRVVWEVPTC